MKTPFTQVPIIDIEPFRNGDAAARHKVAQDVARACEDVGFLYISGHGIGSELIDRASAAARRFYNLPDDEKCKVEMDRLPNHRGYVVTNPGTRDTAGDAERYESYKIGFDTGADDPEFLSGIRFYGPNAWPEEPVEFRPALEHYYAEMLNLSRTIFQLFATALKLDENHFVPWTHKPASIMNVNHYRGGSNGTSPSGIREHSDYECFTILWQDDNGGLEVKNQAGAWVPAPPIDGTFVINIGDIIARWTNDRFACTPHRVIYRGDSNRLSIAFFANCDYSTPIECLPGCHGPDNPPKYPATTVGEHLLDQVRQAYAHVEAYKD